MKLLSHTTSSEQETKNFGFRFAQAMRHAAPFRHAVVVALKGELGSGKTTFVKGFAKGFGIQDIKSPTFILVKSYPLSTTHYKFLYHSDAYRLKNGNDLKMLGWNELIKNPKNIILIEWAERVKSILPKHRIEIQFRHIDKNKRKLNFYAS